MIATLLIGGTEAGKSTAMAELERMAKIADCSHDLLICCAEAIQEERTPDPKLILAVKDRIESIE